VSAPSNVRARALALARRLLDVAPDERAERLRRATAGDADLLRATQALLEADAGGHTLLDTPIDVDYYKNGGILQTVLRSLAKR